MSEMIQELSRQDPAASARAAIRTEQMPVSELGQGLLEEFGRSGVRFASSDPALTQRYARALAKLATCVLPSPEGRPMLIEGGAYQGCWLESTGTINNELLSRFCPNLATETFRLFARHARTDGLIPYKILAGGPAWRQIQMVTPLALSLIHISQGIVR